jgi:cobalt/nickel transport system permease protein
MHLNKISSIIYEIHIIEKNASRKNWINAIHPLIKLFLTIIYIGVSLSFSKYDFIGVFSMMLYLLIVFFLADIPFYKCIWKFKVILPIVLVMGIMDLFFDRNYIIFCNVKVNAGIISMITLGLKSYVSVISSYFLISTTTIEEICYALKLLYVPSIIRTQILLIYRYLIVLLLEVNNIIQAYMLRAPNHKGIHFNVWGSMIGQLLMRSFERAMNIYDSMLLRGYNGEFHNISNNTNLKLSDLLYFFFWVSMFFILRIFPMIYILGNFIGGFFL